MFELLTTLLLTATTLAPLPHSSDLYVSGFFTSSVQRYRGPLNATPGPRPGPGQSDAIYARPVTRRPWGLAFGPDGNLYVANFGTGSDAIMRVEGPFSATAGTVSTFVDGGAFFDVAFGSDGNLYASGHGAVQRFDIITGARIDDFTHGYTLAEVRAIAFGPDGNLYVTNFDGCVTGPAGCIGTRNEIVRFDGLTGAFLDIFVADGQAGMDSPWDLAFGPDGALFVANAKSDGDGNILRFERSTARRRSVGSPGTSHPFATQPGLFPLAIAFGPDHNLYVSTSESGGSDGAILRFNGTSGAFIDAFVPSVDGGPRGMTFAPGPR
jgi:DNA-binding beta-propeller fold protein YncE